MTPQDEIAALKKELAELRASRAQMACVWCGEISPLSDDHGGDFERMRFHMVVCGKHPIHYLTEMLSIAMRALEVIGTSGTMFPHMYARGTADRCLSIKQQYENEMSQLGAHDADHPETDE